MIFCTDEHIIGVLNLKIFPFSLTQWDSLIIRKQALLGLLITTLN